MRAPLATAGFASLIALVAALTFSVMFGQSGEADPTAPNRDPTLSFSDSLLAFAVQLEGTPYQPGGCTAKAGFDCSGLVHYSFREFGVEIGRSSAHQAEAGWSVDRQQARPGDVLVFARSRKGRIFHAGLVLSNDRDSLVMLHANERHGVHRTNVTASKYWSEKVADVRRVRRVMRP